MLIDRELSDRELIGREEFCRMIPHGGDMCLLDAVLSWDEQSIVCESRTHQNPHNPLMKNGQLSTIHAVEYGAQAMAVHGCLLARAKGENLKPGYLAALKDVKLHVPRLDSLSEPLTVRAEQIIAGGGNLMYTFEVSAGNQAVASARATVVTQS